jgi:hypothetical protein
MPPDEKPEGDNVRWISGYFGWDEEKEDFIWISGCYRQFPPGMTFVEGYWKPVEGGWQWIHGFWTKAGEAKLQVLAEAPPEPLAEAEPPRPGDDYVLVSGNWFWRETRYVWRPAFWCPARLGWVWVPAHYVWTPCGYVFIEGYWDVPLNQCGLLFAPVCFDSRILVPGFRYRPCFVVHDECLLGSLFLRRGCRSYFFGDFFDVRCQRLGFVSWTEFSFGRNCYDPLFSYYRWQYRSQPHWERDLCSLYRSRRLGEVARPPVNLHQQHLLAKDGKHLNNVVMLAPINKIDPKAVKMTKLDAVKLAEVKKDSDRMRQVGIERKDLETKILASNKDPKSTAKDRVLQLDLPKQHADIKTDKTPPALPIVFNDKGRLDDKAKDRTKDTGILKPTDGIKLGDGIKSKLDDNKPKDGIKLGDGTKLPKLDDNNKPKDGTFKPGDGVKLPKLDDNKPKDGGSKPGDGVKLPKLDDNNKPKDSGFKPPDGIKPKIDDKPKDSVKIDSGVKIGGSNNSSGSGGSNNGSGRPTPPPPPPTGGGKVNQSGGQSGSGNGGPGNGGPGNGGPGNGKGKK